ncbi:MAG TPA: C45 family peptidase, partial [Gemmataceae bacterium]|nr:C45 family peptidase [Gemmataceae bacterium]
MRGPPSPFRFPPARHGRGELADRAGVPVLRVGGTPAEVGEQLGVLSVRPAARLLDFPEDLLRHTFKSRLLARLLARRATTLGGRLLAQFPDAARRELDGMAAAGLDRGRLVLGNTLYDLKNISLPQVLGCSSLVVPAARSATGGPLFGRNVDFFDRGYLHEYSLVTVRPRTAAALAYATVGFPGLLGCFSGMNEAGLALASHEVFGLPRGRRYNPRGVPFTLAYRRVLEECTRTADVADLLRGMERTTSTLLVLCDRDGGRVLEVTPDHVLGYETDATAITCTNHYRTPELARRRPPKKFRTGERLATLAGRAAGDHSFGLADLTAALHAVHQGPLTVQTMVFEPAWAP